MNQGLTFRSSKIVYYGPHACSQCGAMICKMGQGFGGNAFTYPDGPIYPNTEWHVHVCNPRDILHRKASSAMSRVIQKHPTAQAVKAENLGWFITAASDNCLSGVQTYYDTEDAAWIGAKAKVFPDEGEQDPANDVIRKETQPKFNRPTCRGSYALGSACGHCERCEQEKKNVLVGGSLS